MSQIPNSCDVCQPVFRCISLLCQPLSHPPSFWPGIPAIKGTSKGRSPESSFSCEPHGQRGNAPLAPRALQKDHNKGVENGATNMEVHFSKKPSHRLHGWYIYLQNWVSMKGPMLGFILQHLRACGHHIEINYSSAIINSKLVQLKVKQWYRRTITSNNGI